MVILVTCLLSFSTGMVIARLGEIHNVPVPVRILTSAAVGYMIGVAVVNFLS